MRWRNLRIQQPLTLRDFKREEQGKVIYAGADAIYLGPRHDGYVVFVCLHDTGSPQWNNDTTLEAITILSHDNSPPTFFIPEPTWGSTVRHNDPTDPLTPLLNCEFATISEARTAVESLTGEHAQFYRMRPTYVARRDHPYTVAHMHRTPDGWSWYINSHRLPKNERLARTRADALAAINYELNPLAGLGRMLLGKK